MSYSVGGLVEATDHNTRVASVNAVWGTGGGSSGYGQTALTNVSVNNIVTATGVVEWASLVRTVNNMLAWQSSGSALTQPNPGDIIAWLASFDSSVSTISGPSRFNSPGLVQVASASGSHSATWGSGGTASLSQTATISFGSGDQARYFFNTGGTVGYTITFSSGGGVLAGVWSGIIGGGRSYTMAPAQYWGGTGGTIISGSGGGAYSGESLSVTVSGAGSSSISFNTSLVDGYSNPYFPGPINGTFTITITASHAPASSGLANSWGTPSMSSPNF